MDDITLTINGIIESIPKTVFIKRNLNYLTFRVITNNKLINVTIFNRSFIKNNLTVGKPICLIGKYNKEKNTFTANNILLNPILNPIIEPIYHTTQNIKNKTLNTLILNTLNKENIQNTLPNYIIEKYNFLNEYESLKHIHNPKDINLLKKAKLTLTYKELFDFMFKINYLKTKRINNTKNIIKEININKLNEVIKTLPFELTKDQRLALEDILNDFRKDKRMNRLVIGDVGSGKTIVAFLSVYANFLAGYQSAFLAPTEILATQHYNNILKTLKDIKVELLTSNTTKIGIETTDIKVVYNANGGKNAPIEKCTFESFRLKYYPDVIDKEIGVNQRSHMAEVFEICKNYGESFSLSRRSLLMTGGTGLGKTHLSLAIAGKAIDKGYNVCYESAQNLMDKLEREHFSREGDGSFKQEILSCDLLIIDDLGCEFQTQFTKAELYNIVNTRHLRSLPTIINTNLSLSEIEEVYHQRVASRIVGNYAVILFCGTDNRQN